MVNKTEHIAAVEQSRASLLQSFRSMLQYHCAIGIENYPKSKEIVSFFSTTIEPEASHEQLGVEKPDPPKRQTGEVETPETKPLIQLSDIAEEVESCTACDLRQKRIYPVPGKGKEKVRLLLVGDWLAAGPGDQLPPGYVFGVEQDVMLSRMLTAMNLPKQDVFVTNVIKCAVGFGCQPEALHVERCVSYLHRQIRAIRPEMICTMGMVAARALLKRTEPLSRLRSHFHDYDAGNGQTIPVMITYHPTYLLQNPEMKMATWSDLQLLAKKLGLTVRS